MSCKPQFKFGDNKEKMDSCENPVGLSKNDGPMEAVEYIWMNTWCMLNWIVGFCHKIAEIHFLGIQLIN